MVFLVASAAYNTNNFLAYLLLQELVGPKMSSLPYSLPLCTPKNHTAIAFSNSSSSSSPLLIKNLSKVAQHSQPQDTASSLQVISGKCQKLVGRREALLATGLLSAGILGGAQLATASEEGSCEFTIVPSGLGFCDKVIGIGPQASQGQLIKAHYVGRLEEDGKVFDSSYNRGKPLTFRVGVGEVIKGWDQGILGAEGIPPMFGGGKRRLKIPPELGYGIRGAGCRGGSCIIPPNSVLLFDVEFIGKVLAQMLRCITPYFSHVGLMCGKHVKFPS